MSVADNVKQARVLSGYAPHIAKNDPAEYADKQPECFAGATAMFRKARLRYASDFVEASVQFWRDLNKTAPWKTVKLRFANVVRPSSAIQRNFDDYKQVISDDPSIGYLRPGAKIRCMGSTWLVVNPDNISGGEGMAIIRRCNAVWNHLDYYGNIVSEPIIVENARANCSSPDTQAEENISTGYVPGRRTTTRGSFSETQEIPMRTRKPTRSRATETSSGSSRMSRTASGC